jgi:hypothetical protein
MNVPGFDRAEHGASQREIEGAERLLGVRFPESYSEVLALYAGAYGDAVYEFSGSGAGGSVGCWLSLSPWDTESLWTALSSWTEHGLPRSVVPFAADGGGNYICLDYRNTGAPVVSAWFHELPGENGLTRVAPSFEAFLAILRPHEG